MAILRRARVDDEGPNGATIADRSDCPTHPIVKLDPLAMPQEDSEPPHPAHARHYLSVPKQLMNGKLPATDPAHVRSAHEHVRRVEHPRFCSGGWWRHGHRMPPLINGHVASGTLMLLDTNLAPQQSP